MNALRAPSAALHHPRAVWMVIYLWHYFKQYRAKHYERLPSVRDGGDWEAWLEFFLTGVRNVAIEASRTSRRIVELRERDRNQIVDQCGRATGNVLRIHERLFSHPVMDVSSIVDTLDVTFATANQLVNRLVKMNVLTEITGQARHRKFRYQAYVDLFGEANG